MNKEQKRRERKRESGRKEGRKKGREEGKKEGKRKDISELGDIKQPHVHVAVVPELMRE